MDRWVTTQRDITSLLSRVGRALLLIAGVRFFTVTLPFRLLQPEWYLLTTRELINLSPVLLTGTTMLLATSRIAFARKPKAGLRWGKRHKLLLWATYFYALLIPVQIGATLVFDNDLNSRQAQQLQAVQGQLKTAREGTEVMNRDLRIEKLQAMEAGLLANRRQLRQRRYVLGLESLRVCGSAGVMVWLLSSLVRKRR
jgi:hypothetical protein